MKQKNVEFAKAVVAQFARGNFAFADDEFELVTSPELPDATYRGATAREFIGACVEPFDELEVLVAESIDGGDKVFLGLIQRGRLGIGKTVVEGRSWHVLTFDAARLARAELYSDRADALKAFERTSSRRKNRSEAAA